MVFFMLCVFLCEKFACTGNALSWAFALYGSECYLFLKEVTNRALPHLEPDRVRGDSACHIAVPPHYIKNPKLKIQNPEPSLVTEFCHRRLRRGS